MNETTSPTPAPTFRTELVSLINRYSKENGSDTPDFILAGFLVGCLDAFDTTLRLRENWYGRAPKVTDAPQELTSKPGVDVPPTPAS